ncbi:hypothetical protein BSL78_07513 [Apostichopus japonicus]|uniref:BPL/LPL catalytic domain-containing protein n=1 Tax=Stichopus japonicus TaxID=307972 RepID=A0A2G8L5L8_STIJA|nr:hypothetical protein BSL78_07513 [Apostichopus japonicus]
MKRDTLLSLAGPEMSFAVSFIHCAVGIDRSYIDGMKFLRDAALCSKVPKTVGAVAVASRQTKGKGRGGNKWLSPLGCAMFTAHVQFQTGTKLGSKLPFLQHMPALAAVEAIRTRPGYENLDLGVKWPNDIYFGGKQKVGGVMVKSSCMGRDFHALVGIGFNVANSKPTLCVNDIIEEYNEKNQTDLSPLKVEEVIAWTLTVLEKMIDDFQREGHLQFCKHYYQRWLHNNSVVHLEREDGPEVTVIGLDGSGFLEVKDKDGKLISLQPDGNSFDMLKNLIQMKKSPWGQLGPHSQGLQLGTTKPSVTVRAQPSPVWKLETTKPSVTVRAQPSPVWKLETTKPGVTARDHQAQGDSW